MILSDSRSTAVSAVIIGRNEGRRLVSCLASVSRSIEQVVYVDSGSTDGSVAAAQNAGARVVELDMSRPFTAARARNAGIEALHEFAMPEYVQFVDGDCELQPDWLSTALAFLEENPNVAVACGRRRERSPGASVYNRLCDREWNTPIGKTRACGGDALMRWKALDQAQGYNPGLIAGEEPELCLRLRKMGWEIWRLDAEMTLHDANITRFSQWWKRMRRSGHASAEGMAMHGGRPERHGVARVTRALFWGVGLPVLIAAGAIAVTPWILLLVCIYPLQMLRLALRSGGKKGDWEEAIFLVLGKFAEASGIAEYCYNRWGDRPANIIEYK